MNLCISRQKLWSCGILLLLAAAAYRELIYWVPETLFLPSSRGWFFLLSDSTPHLLYLLGFGLLLTRYKYLIRAYHEKSSHWPGLIILAMATITFGWGHMVNAIDHIHLSFLMALIGSAWLVSGRSLARALLIPVLILFIGTPLPAVLINQIVLPFQIWSADHVIWLLQLFGETADRTGITIVMDRGKFQVVETCTALGFMKWLITFALAYVYLFPVSRTHSILLVISAALIAYCVNLLRIISLIYDPGIHILALHTLQGVVFFILGFVFLYLFDVTLMRLIPVRSARQVAPGNTDTDKHSRYQIATLALFFSIILFIPWSIPRTPAPVSTLTETILPDQVGDWILLRELKRNGKFLGTLQYKYPQYKRYWHARKTISIFTAFDDRRRRNRSFYSDKNAYPHHMGITRERYTVNLQGIQMTGLVTEHKQVRYLSYSWYTGVESTGNELARALLALDQSPYRRTEAAKFTRVSTKIANITNGRQLARERLADFLNHM